MFVESWNYWLVSDRITIAGRARRTTRRTWPHWTRSRPTWRRRSPPARTSTPSWWPPSRRRSCCWWSTSPTSTLPRTPEVGGYQDQYCSETWQPWFYGSIQNLWVFHNFTIFNDWAERLSTARSGQREPPDLCLKWGDFNFATSKFQGFTLGLTQL